MEMGDWYLFTNQLKGICVRIKIKALLLRVKYGPCVIYGKIGIRRRIFIILVWKVLEGMKKKDLV
jgi:hypothetical protein